MRSAFGIIIGKIIGLMCFLIILVGLNLANAAVQNNILELITGYLNSSLMIVLAFSFLFLLADLFSIFSFPFNLVYPIFNAFASVFVILFLSGFIIAIAFQDFAMPAFDTITRLFLFFVPFIVLIVGYAKIFFKKERIEKPFGTEKKRQKGEVGEELRGLILDIIRKMRKGLSEGGKPSAK